MSHESHRYPVVVTVFVHAEGVDEQDAYRVAEAAVQKALGDTITVHTHSGVPRSARVIDVMEIGTVLQSKFLSIRPSRVAESPEVRP